MIQNKHHSTKTTHDNKNSI